MKRMPINDKMMNKINSLEKLELSKEINNEKNENTKFRSRGETISTIRSDTTVKTNQTARTTQSKPFKRELDLDLPDFSPTKYASPNWKFPHCFFYFAYSGALLGANISFVFSENFKTYNTVSLVAHACYCISSFMEWLYFKRGCIGRANLNSKIKDNIDKSLKAKILRSEQGWKYFFSFFASIVLVLGNVYYITYNNKNGDNYDKGIFPDAEFWNINLIGVMIISLAQIWKISKILTQTRQYMIQNDLSNCLIEIFFYFASLFFGTLYFFNLTYNTYDSEKFETFYKVTRIGGSVFTIFSSLSLINRYYMSSYDDLNTSDLSNVTL